MPRHFSRFRNLQVQLLAQQAEKVFFYFALAALIAAALVAWGLTRSITRQLGGEPRYAADIMNQIATGEAVNATVAAMKQIAQKISIIDDIAYGFHPKLAINLSPLLLSHAVIVQEITQITDTQPMPSSPPKWCLGSRKARV